MKKDRFLTYTSFLNTLYWHFMLNLFFIITSLPFILVSVFSALDARNVFFYFLAAISLGPSFCAIYACLDKLREVGHIHVFRDYFSNYGRCIKKALLIELPALLILGICFMNMMFFSNSAWFIYIRPVWIFIMAVTIAWCINSYYFYIRNQDKALKDIWKMALYYVFRKWWLSLLTILVSVGLLVMMLLSPVVGNLVLPSMLIHILYWIGSGLHVVDENGMLVKKRK